MSKIGGGNTRHSFAQSLWETTHCPASLEAQETKAEILEDIFFVKNPNLRCRDSTPEKKKKHVP